MHDGVSVYEPAPMPTPTDIASRPPPFLCQVELQSRETLVARLAYCLMHQVACREHPVLARCVGPRVCVCMHIIAQCVFVLVRLCVCMCARELLLCLT